MRALRKAAAPILADAKSNAPRRTGRLADSIIVTAKARDLRGLKEYGQTLAGGGTVAEAKTALRDVRRSTDPTGARAEVIISVKDPKGHLLEFGTSKMPAQPFMRPAWEEGKDGALLSISQELKSEIEKSVARAARRAARLAAKG